MSLLFAEHFFDAWHLSEGTIRTFVTYTIDGRYEKEFFHNGERAEEDACPFVSWGILRESCLNLIKGRNTPLYMKFVLRKEPADFPALPDGDNVDALLLLIRFDSSGLVLTSGLSQKSFTMDKDAEEFWDKELRKLILSTGIAEEEL
ncbi:MAG: DUF5721 family protein [Lachnospiraceae bacterium]|nr:DUF5721 family protein [Lachnospiraceae bacterium]